ncbi:MAG: hypothetical protein ACHQAV_01590 [Solirubrobacterales bacterium]
MSINDDRLQRAVDSPGDRRRDVDRRSARRQRDRRTAVKRRRRLAGLALLVALAVAIASISAGSSGTGRGSPLGRALPHTPPVATRAAVPRAPARARLAAVPEPGSLPQTHAYPPAAGARFKMLMASLWSGISEDSTAPAAAAFFPKDAYVQLKAIPSASSDWVGRLMHDYSLDIHAAHALLGAGAAGAQLIAVEVPSGYGHWVSPGDCYNGIGYYEVPNARVVYREDGQIRSFGIASMISWRGVWYVVHLGAVLRPAETGTVDEPASGHGSSADSGTC